MLKELIAYRKAVAGEDERAVAECADALADAVEEWGRTDHITSLGQAARVGQDKWVSNEVEDTEEQLKNALARVAELEAQVAALQLAGGAAVAKGPLTRALQFAEFATRSQKPADSHGAALAIYESTILDVAAELGVARNPRSTDILPVLRARLKELVDEKQRRMAAEKKVVALKRAAGAVMSDPGHAGLRFQLAELISDRAEPPDPRPLCITCKKPWTPDEGVDATVTPCASCAMITRAELVWACEDVAGRNQGPGAWALEQLAKVLKG